ncbi:MAG TPA: hypothetical protein VHK69_03920 [Chitinophagaceae bacterium]|nr:hypothetical protein [Chitinophagaceae bacterium]
MKKEEVPKDPQQPAQPEGKPSSAPTENESGFTYVPNANASGAGALGRSEEQKLDGEGSIQEDTY